MCEGVSGCVYVGGGGVRGWVGEGVSVYVCRGCVREGCMCEGASVSMRGVICMWRMYVCRWMHGGVNVYLCGGAYVVRWWMYGVDGCGRV